MHFLSIRFLLIVNVIVEQADDSATDNVVFLTQESKDSFLDPYFNEVNVNFVEVNFNVVFIWPLTVLQHALRFVSKTRVLII
jgi:hypothetical protein